ncbi:MAG: hypothetical protein ABEJ89_06275 [Haloarculaceae archaeon]
MAGQQPASDPFEAYVGSVGQRLGQRGYSRRQDGPQGYRTTVFHRRTFSITKFGYVDYFVVVARFDSLSPAEAEAFSEAAFRYGLSNKSALPRGLGGTVVVYPVILGQNLPNTVHQWASHYRNNHFAAFEFPVVADLGPNHLVYNADKPLWGRAYYSGFQTIADTCLTPQAGGGAGRRRPAAGGPPR